MTTKNRIINPSPPSLPLGTDQYERRYQDQFANILRLYFNQLQNALTEITGNAGGKYLAFPYGAFSDFTDQTTTVNTATVMALSVTDFSNEGFDIWEKEEFITKITETKIAENNFIKVVNYSKGFESVQLFFLHWKI